MAKRKRRGIKKAAYAHIARPLVYATLDYLAVPSLEQKKIFDPIKAAKPLLEKRNFQKIQKTFNAFVKHYNKSEENTLSDNYHAINFLAAFTDKKSDLKILKNAQYQFLIFCCHDIVQQPHNEAGKGLADIFAKSLAYGLSVDNKNSSQKGHGSLEKELTGFIKKIANMVTTFEQDSKGFPAKNNFIEQINQAEIKTPNQPPNTLVHFVVSMLYKAYLSMMSLFSNIIGLNNKKTDAHRVKKSKFDEHDFIKNHKNDLPDIIFLMNYIFSQTTHDDKEAQQFIYGLFKMSFLKKNISLRDKIFGKWSDTFLKYLKKEDVLQAGSLEEKEDITRRNNAREHLLDIALHNLFPEMGTDDYFVFKREFQDIIQKMEEKIDLVKITPAMIDILRKPENQSTLLPLIEAGVSKFLRYSPEQLSQDAARNFKMAKKEVVALPKESHFVSEFVSYLLASKISAEHLAHILKKIPSGNSKDPTAMIVGLLVSKGSHYPNEYGYRDELIQQLILEKPATFLRFITKVTLEVLRKGRRGEEQLMSHFCKAFDGDPVNLSLLVTGIADLAVARDTKNHSLTKKGVGKILQILPLLNEHLLQASPPNQLAKSFASILFKKPNNPKKRQLEEIENMQLAFLQSVVADIVNSTAEDKNSWIESLADIIGVFETKATLFQKIRTVAQSHHMKTGMTSLGGFYRAYNSLTKEQKEVMSECYPQLYNFLTGMSYMLPAANMAFKVVEKSYKITAAAIGLASSAMFSFLGSFQEPKFKHQKPSVSEENESTHAQSLFKELKPESKIKTQSLTTEDNPVDQKRSQKVQR